MRKQWLGSIALSSFAVATLVAQSPAKRPVRVGDMYRLKNVGDVDLSPDGKWIAYTVTSTDSAKDRTDTDVWMATWDGSRTIQATSTPDNETSPKFSPGGRYLSFLSSRQGGHGAQLWLLDRQGGEARRLTDLKTGIEEYEWSPDATPHCGHHERRTGRRGHREQAAEALRDGQAALQERRRRVSRRHGTRASLRARRRHRQSRHPDAWPVRGERALLVTRRTIDRVREQARRGRSGSVRKLRRVRGRGAARIRRAAPHELRRSRWLSLRVESRRRVARLHPRRRSEVERVQSKSGIAIVPATGGDAHFVATLDRPMSSPKFTADGKSILALITDDRAAISRKIDVNDR